MKWAMGKSDTIQGDVVVAADSTTTCVSVVFPISHCPFPISLPPKPTLAAVSVAWGGCRVTRERTAAMTTVERPYSVVGTRPIRPDGVDKVTGRAVYGADVRMAINAGVDIVMAAEQHWTFLPILRAEVEAGRIPMARIDDANRRILRRKFALGLFERPYADRSRIGDVGSPAHRAVAREAVQKSMVVLKNDGVLPLPRAARKVFAEVEKGGS